MADPARFATQAGPRRRRRRGRWRAADIVPDETGGDPRSATLALLARRSASATICPSEVARAIAASGSDWRDSMPDVHAAVDALVAEGLVRLSWKGRPKTVRDGPYRIGRPAR